MVNDWRAAPYRTVRFPALDLEIRPAGDGGWTLRTARPLPDYEPSVIVALAANAARYPDRIWLHEQDAAGVWQGLSFAEAWHCTAVLACWLIDTLPASARLARRPMALLSANSRSHALLTMAAMLAGVPVCSISTNYTLLGQRGPEMPFARLSHVMELLQPALVFADQLTPYAAAFTATAPADARLLLPAGAGDQAGAVHLPDVATAVVEAARVSALLAAMDVDAPARLMLTSGSTGRPKAVIHTQRMITSNIAQTMQVMQDAYDWGGVIPDWLPWSHASGATHLMATALLGGTLYIDTGRPVPSQFAPTLALLRRIPLRSYGNVPAGYAMLADALEDDAELRACFFSELKVMLFGGAGLPQALSDRLQALACQQTGHRILVISGYGSTETTSGCLATWFQTEKVGVGLPVPGVTLKLVPHTAAGEEGVYEARLRGPNITPGYFADPAQTEAAFDDEDFFCMGDLLRFIDPADPGQGLAFVGRTAEQFKLASGTFVSSGDIRTAILRALPDIVSEAVVCGDDREAVGILAWPNLPGIRRLLSHDVTAEQVASIAPVRAAVAEFMAVHNRDNPGASARIHRWRFLVEPPCASEHEVSDKGSINRRRVIERRARCVHSLYADPTGDDSVLTAGVGRSG